MQRPSNGYRAAYLAGCSMTVRLVTVFFTRRWCRVSRTTRRCFLTTVLSRTGGAISGAGSGAGAASGGGAIGSGGGGGATSAL